MAAGENSRMKIAMFPWLAFGHMIPYLNLAKLIAEKGNFVYFISTTKNIDRLPKIPPNLSTQMTFIKMTLPHTPGLPEGAEATSDLPGEKVPLLKISFDGLAHQLAQFLGSASPAWLIHDFAHFWAGPVASKLGIPTMFLSIFTAPLLASCGTTEDMLDEVPESKRGKNVTVEDLTVKAKWISFETSVVPPYFGAKPIVDWVYRDNSSGVTDTYRLAMSVKNCKVVAVRGSYEVDPEWLEDLEKIYRKPVLPIGQLPPLTDLVDSSATNLLISEWLDSKDSSSVIYVAFGSEANIDRQDLTELALGLELSRMPFLWVLKKSQDSDLPDGFKKRTKDRGIVYTDWAPQLMILSHGSVGVFLSHSGWSSAVESISLQKPLILLPLFGDQFYNYRFLEERKLGYAIPRDEIDGSFTRDSVAAAVKLVLLDEEGKVFRETVKEMSGLFSDTERQNQYVDKFVECLSTYRKS